MTTSTLAVGLTDGGAHVGDERTLLASRIRTSLDVMEMGDSANTFTMQRPTHVDEACFETETINTVTADANNCAGITMGLANSQTLCEAVLTDDANDGSAKACTYTSGNGEDFIIQ